MILGDRTNQASPPSDSDFYTPTILEGLRAFTSSPESYADPLPHSEQSATPQVTASKPPPIGQLAKNVEILHASRFCAAFLTDTFGDVSNFSELQEFIQILLCHLKPPSPRSSEKGSSPQTSFAHVAAEIAYATAFLLQRIKDAKPYWLKTTDPILLFITTMVFACRHLHEGVIVHVPMDPQELTSIATFVGRVLGQETDIREEKLEQFKTRMWRKFDRSNGFKDICGCEKGMGGELGRVHPGSEDNGHIFSKLTFSKLRGYLDGLRKYYC